MQHSKRVMRYETAVRNILAVLNGEEAVTPVNQRFVTKKRNLPESEGFLFSLFALLMVFV